MTDHRAIGARTYSHRAELTDTPAAIAGAIAAVRAMLTADQCGKPANFYHLDSILGAAEAAADGLHRRVLLIVDDEGEGGIDG